MNPSGMAAWQDDDAERRKALTAIIASVLLHLLLILAVALLFTLRPAPTVPEPPKPEELAPVELTFIDPPPSLPKIQPTYVDTTHADAAKKPPENMTFESDRDTTASSSGPAGGNLPVPTMEGEQTPDLNMQNREYTPGPAAQPSTPSVAMPAQPQTAPTPLPEEKQPEPVPTPRQVSQLALLEPPKPKSTPRPETEKPAPPVPQTQPRPAQPPGYQPQTRVTRIRGNISNRGRASVDAVATPLGRYKKMLSDAIGSRWYYYVNNQMGLLSVGTVELRFIVTPDGKAQKVQVTRNSSNESFAACSVQAVMDAEIPPIPADLVPMLDNGRIEIEYSFTILSN